MLHVISHFLFFFFNDTATTEIYTLSLHDALPICGRVFRHPRHARHGRPGGADLRGGRLHLVGGGPRERRVRSEEDTAELQSPCYFVFRLLVVKKKTSSDKRRKLRPEYFIS